MAKNDILEDLARRVRGVIKDLEDMLNPQPERAPVPIPIPVRNPRPTRRNPY